MIEVDLNSGVPVEEQIRSQVREQIALGALRDGHRLPSARQLAADLTVHFTTIARAYRRLVDDGLVRVRRGRGAFVRRDDSGSPPSLSEPEPLRRDLRRVLTDGRLAGLSGPLLRDFVLRELERFERQEMRP